MKTQTVLTVVASAAFAVFAQGAFAQASAPVSRADVKAETKAAPKTPAGQGPGAMTSGKAGPSDLTRDERKTQTKADAKSGQLAPAGEAGAQKQEKAEKTTKSTMTKEERKAQAKADQKAGKMAPAGAKADQK